MTSLAALSYKSPTVELSFETRVSSEIDPTLVKIEVCLRFKNILFTMDRRGQVFDEFIYHRTTGESNVSFAFRVDSIGLSVAAYFRDEFHRWLPSLVPVCDLLSQYIVQCARLVALTRVDLNGGATVVRASMEVLEVDDLRVDFDLQNVPTIIHNDGPPRGLSWGEINSLKQETFKSGGDCSVCLEELSPGVKITPLPCSHSFHHSCIASWLEKHASCPLCRLDITKSRHHRATLMILL